MKGLTNHQAAVVIDEVARERRLASSDIAGRGRYRMLVRARREVWRRLVADGVSSVQAGLATGHDHSTVLHGLKAIASRVDLG